MNDIKNNTQIRFIEVFETYAVRIEVLRNGKQENYRFQGDELSDSFHLGAFVNNRCVGVLSLLPNSLPNMPNQVYQLRGMAVLPGYRRAGLGRKLWKLAKTAIMKNTQARMVWCNAREEAVGFYLLNGFEIISEAFEIPGIGLHYRMKNEW
jgi:predicted GNAT family N-acyltransferase